MAYHSSLRNKGNFVYFNLKENNFPKEGSNNCSLLYRFQFKVVLDKGHMICNVHLTNKYKCGKLSLSLSGVLGRKSNTT